MKDFWDLFRAFTADTTERVKFPLINSFAISWMIFNWKPIFIVLFSEQSMEGRISYITTHYSNPLYIWIWPAIISAVYVLGLPYVKREIHLYLDEINRENRDNTYDFRISGYEKKLLLADKETELELKKASNLDLAQLNQKVTTQNSEIEYYKKELIKLNDVLREAHDQLSGKSGQLEMEQRRNNQLTFEKDNLLFEIEEMMDRTQSTLMEFLASTQDFTSNLPDGMNERMRTFLDQKSKTANYITEDYKTLKEKLNKQYGRS